MHWKLILRAMSWDQRLVKSRYYPANHSAGSPPTSVVLSRLATIQSRQPASLTRGPQRHFISEQPSKRSVE
jgi:hypothetical protein